MIKIFEIKEYTDGGPNDKGAVVGYVTANNRKEASKNLENVFQTVNEISRETYLFRKKQAEEQLKLFQLTIP